MNDVLTNVYFDCWTYWSILNHHFIWFYMIWKLDLWWSTQFQWLARTLMKIYRHNRSNRVPHSAIVLWRSICVLVYYPHSWIFIALITRPSNYTPILILGDENEQGTSNISKTKKHGFISLIKSCISSPAAATLSYLQRSCPQHAAGPGWSLGHH